ncbi:hypothetical protein ACFXG4_37910 [Nocardia sp. NPDC059246]|uniref:hypothetical protein n=1 Tax=unclassified Nocardia TaxID=2637762 RepID=UPI00369A6A9D
MRLHRKTLVLATAVAVSTAAAVAAAPASADAGAADSVVNFHADMQNGWVATSLDAGQFAPVPDGGSIVILDDGGQTVGRIPLAFRLADREYAVQQEISEDGRTLRLAADLGGSAPPAQPVASPLENQLAANDALSKLGLAAAVGPLAGAAAGAVLGAVVALATCAVLTIGCLLTGLPIIGVFAGAGGLAGTILAGGGAAAYGAWNYLNTLAAEPGKSQYHKDGYGTDGAGVPDSVLRVPKLATGSSGGSSSGSGKH